MQNFEECSHKKGQCHDLGRKYFNNFNRVENLTKKVLTGIPKLKY